MIRYRLDLFIKHKSKTEFGQGNFVSFPILIRQKQQVVPPLKVLQELTNAVLGKDFKPHTTWPLVMCGIGLNGNTGMLEATTRVEGGEAQVQLASQSTVYEQPQEHTEAYNPLQAQSSLDPIYDPY